MIKLYCIPNFVKKIITMNTERVQLRKGEKYSIKYLQETGIIKINHSSLYHFYKKDNLTYVLYKDIVKHPNEYEIAAIWEN